VPSTSATPESKAFGQLPVIESGRTDTNNIAQNGAGINQETDRNILEQRSPSGENLQPDITTQPQPGEPQMTASEYTDMSNPIGEVPLNGTPSPEPYGSTLQEIYQDVRPLLARAREQYKQSMNENRQFKLGEIDPASQAEVRKWIKQVQTDMTGVKYAALAPLLIPPIIFENGGRLLIYPLFSKMGGDSECPECKITWRREMKLQEDYGRTSGFSMRQAGSSMLCQTPSRSW
jgi:hypothetical protein